MPRSFDEVKELAEILSHNSVSWQLCPKVKQLTPQPTPPCPDAEHHASPCAAAGLGCAARADGLAAAASATGEGPKALHGTRGAIQTMEIQQTVLFPF